MPKTLGRSRKWCFTIFLDGRVKGDYRDFSTYSEWQEHDVAYLVTQIEKCPETERLHWQGFVYFNDPKSLSQVKRVLGSRTAHLEHAYGTPMEAADYCKKEESRIEGPFEWGEVPRQGGRTDLDEFAESMKRGISGKELFELHPKCYIRYGRMADRITSWYEKKEINVNKSVHVRWGAPGTGKTREAWDSDPNLCPLMINASGQLWADSYHGQKTVLLDDFAGEISLSLLLRLLDIYPMRIETKGGSVNFVADTVWITSNLDPSLWYPRASDAQRMALIRRFTSLKHYTESVAPRSGGVILPPSSPVGDAVGPPLLGLCDKDLDDILDDLYSESSASTSEVCSDADCASLAGYE